MTSADRPSREPVISHHFRPPDPRDVVDRPAPTDGAPVQGPVPPRPWYLLVVGQWPVFVTLLAVTTGVVVAGASYWRRGATIAGAGVLLGAVLRLVLPERVAGLLCCRAKAFDVTLTALIGVGIVALAWIIDPTRK